LTGKSAYEIDQACLKVLDVIETETSDMSVKDTKWFLKELRSAVRSYFS